MPIIGPNDNNLNTDSSIGTHLSDKVNLDTLSFKTIYGEIVPFKGVMREINIFESMFSSAIYGTISIRDNQGVLEKYLISGGEEIEIKVLKQKTNKLIFWRKDLIVHKISKSTVKTDLSTDFIIYFTTKAFVKSTKKRIFKSFKNITIEDAVKNIYKEVSNNPITIENPKLTFDSAYVCPGLNPHSVIDYFAKISCSKNNFFVFFERLSPFIVTDSDSTPDATSHYFGSVENLIDNQTTVYTILYRDNINASIEKNLGQNYIRTNNFTRASNFNHIESMLSGAYNSKISSIDPIQKTWNVIKNSYVSKDVVGDFYKNPIISKNVIFAEYDDLKYEFPGERLIVSIKNDKQTKENWLSEYMYGYLTKNIFKVETTIEGGTNTIGTGTVINIEIPSHYQKIINSQDASVENDLFYSGKYIVTAVKHTLSLENYSKTLELSRGSSPINLGRVESSYENKSIDNTINKPVKEQPIVLFSTRRYPDLLNTILNIPVLKTNISIQRDSSGILSQNSLSAIKALGIELSGNLLTDRSYKILAQAIKNGEFVNLDDALYVTYPGNIRTLSGANAATIRSKIQENL